MDGGQARIVIAREPHVGREHRFVKFNFMAQGLQARHAAADHRLLAHCAGRRINIDVFFHRAKYPTAA